MVGPEVTRGRIRRGSGRFVARFSTVCADPCWQKHRIRNGTLQAAVYLVPSNGMDNSFKDDLSPYPKGQ